MGRRIPNPVRAESAMESSVDGLPPDEPRQNAPQADSPHQQAEGSGNPSHDVSTSSVSIPIGPQGPESPHRTKKTGRRGTEYRDRSRLGVEILTLVVTIVGLVGLFITLSDIREATKAAMLAAGAAEQSANIARDTLIASTRPWIGGQRH
jgi:hypothetical protein